MDAAAWDVVLSVALGVGLAAACGFRIFVPLLVVSAASLTGRLELTEGMAWLGTTPALVVLGVATVAEIAAYYIPWVDNVLDWLGAPVAIVAGTVISASVLTDVDPMLRWTLAAIAGGGAAGAVHGSMALIRKLSSFTTGGIGNPVVATGEAGGSLALSALAIAAPALALLSLVLVAFFLVRAVRRRRRRRAHAAAVVGAP